jgi:hypothetical protein
LVIVESALINASKGDGRCWDVGCNQKQSAEVAKAAANAAKAVLVATAAASAAVVAPFAAAFVILAPMAAKAMSLPDAAGTASVITGGAMAPGQTLMVQRDTLTPQWGVGFTHVPVLPDTALRIALVDADADIPFTNGDDPMGIINITGADLFQAMQVGGTFQVPVATQTSDQVLFVGISVHPER